MRIMIVTDAWFPQTNGVVSTLAQTAAWLGRFGHEVRMLTPKDFCSVACPTYPEVRLSIFPYRKVESDILAFNPQALHIATEGPLGLSARACSSSIRAPLLPAINLATSWQAISPPRTSWCSPAAPIPSAWSTWRRWHAGCR